MDIVNCSTYELKVELFEFNECYIGLFSDMLCYPVISRYTKKIGVSVLLHKVKFQNSIVFEKTST